MSRMAPFKRHAVIIQILLGWCRWRLLQKASSRRSRKMPKTLTDPPLKRQTLGSSYSALINTGMLCVLKANPQKSIVKQLELLLYTTLYSFRANKKGVDPKSYHHLWGQKLLVGRSQRRSFLNLWLQHLLSLRFRQPTPLKHPTKAGWGCQPDRQPHETFAPRDQGYDAVHQVPGCSHLEANDHRCCQRVPRMRIDDRRLS